MTYVSIQYNDDIWIMQRHELVEYLERRIAEIREDVINPIEEFAIGENVGQVQWHLGDHDSLEKLQNALRRTRQAIYQEKIEVAHSMTTRASVKAALEDGDLLAAKEDEWSRLSAEQIIDEIEDEIIGT